MPYIKKRGSIGLSRVRPYTSRQRRRPKNRPRRGRVQRRRKSGCFFAFFSFVFYSVQNCIRHFFAGFQPRIGLSFGDLKDSAFSVAGAAFAGGLLAGPFGMAAGSALGGLAQYASHRYRLTKHSLSISFNFNELYLFCFLS